MSKCRILNCKIVILDSFIFRLDTTLYLAIVIFLTAQFNKIFVSYTTFCLAISVV
jgi:hypothetical protein